MPVKIHNHPPHPIWLGFRKMLAFIMAAWVFSLSGSIHLLHTGSSFQIIDCPENQCALFRHSESSDADTCNRQQDHRIYPYRAQNHKCCPACDFLSKSKSEYAFFCPDIAPPLEICQSSIRADQIMLSRAADWILFARAPPAA